MRDNCARFSKDICSLLGNTNITMQVLTSIKHVVNNGWPNGAQCLCYKDLRFRPSASFISGEARPTLWSKLTEHINSITVDYDEFPREVFLQSLSIMYQQMSASNRAKPPTDMAVPVVTVHPKKYAHGFCFPVLCCGYTLTDFPISIRLTSLALLQSNDCPSASKATLMDMDKYFMWIHYERLHNHNKAKHNKTVCIFLGIYCRYLFDFLQRMLAITVPNHISFSRWRYAKWPTLYRDIPWHSECWWNQIQLNLIIVVCDILWISRTYFDNLMVYIVPFRYILDKNGTE